MDPSRSPSGHPGDRLRSRFPVGLLIGLVAALVATVLVCVATTAGNPDQVNGLPEMASPTLPTASQATPSLAVASAVRSAPAAPISDGGSSVHSPASITTPPPISISLTQLQRSAAYAKAHGYTVGLAVIDTKTRHGFSAGWNGLYSTESVAKLFIATRLLLTGQMHGWVASTAYRMITQSDDNAANALYGLVGGDSVLSWIKLHYGMPHLGTGPSQPGWWGLNHVYPTQLVYLLLKLHSDSHVWPWLGNAMAHATHYGADGVDQSFGLRQVDAHALVKQGWGLDYSRTGTPAQLNTTGFVVTGRYAVVIMVRGPYSSYFTRISHMITSVTKLGLTGSL